MLFIFLWNKFLFVRVVDLWTDSLLMSSFVKRFNPVHLKMIRLKRTRSRIGHRWAGGAKGGCIYCLSVHIPCLSSELWDSHKHHSQRCTRLEIKQSNSLVQQLVNVAFHKPPTMDDYHLFCASCRKTEKRQTTVRESDNMSLNTFLHVYICTVSTLLFQNVAIFMNSNDDMSNFEKSFHNLHHHYVGCFMDSHFLIVSLIRIASPRLLWTLLNSLAYYLLMWMKIRQLHQ